MRIIDWSSDVYSSDLAQSPIGSNNPTVNNGFNTPTPTPDDPVLLTNSAYKMVAIDDQSVQQNDAFSQTSQQLQQTTTGSNTGTNNVLSAVPEPETWVQQIGRASCRERVCRSW